MGVQAVLAPGRVDDRERVVAGTVLEVATRSDHRPHARVAVGSPIGRGHVVRRGPRHGGLGPRQGRLIVTQCGEGSDRGATGDDEQDHEPDAGGPAAEGPAAEGPAAGALIRLGEALCPGRSDDQGRLGRREVSCRRSGAGWGAWCGAGWGAGRGAGCGAGR